MNSIKSQSSGPDYKAIINLEENKNTNLIELVKLLNESQVKLNDKFIKDRNKLEYIIKLLNSLGLENLSQKQFK